MAKAVGIDLGTALDQIAQEVVGTIKLVRINMDSAPRISQRFGVQSIPTLLVMQGPEVVARHIGALPAPALRTWVERALAGRAER